MYWKANLFIQIFLCNLKIYFSKKDVAQFGVKQHAEKKHAECISCKGCTEDWTSECQE